MRFQFSLKFVLFSMMVMGLALGWWKSSTSHVTIRKRHELLLKDWVQPLEVVDSKALYHRSLPTWAAGLNRWKVYLPPGNKFELQCAITRTPEGRVPYGGGVVARIPLPPGYSLIEVDWKKDRNFIPHVSIALLRPTQQDTKKVLVQFPGHFITMFSRGPGVSCDMYGWEDSNKASSLRSVAFFSLKVAFIDTTTYPGQSIGSFEGLEIKIRQVDDNPSIEAAN
jgi:hypothetical protein